MGKDDFKDKYRVDVSEDDEQNYGHGKEPDEYMEGIPLYYFENEKQVEPIKYGSPEYKRRQLANAMYEPEEKGEPEEAPKRYKPVKGHPHKAEKRRRKLRPNVIATVLSILAIGSAIGIVRSQRQNEETQTLDQLVEEQADINSLGLSQETIDTLLEYSEYFEDADNIIKKDLMTVSSDLYYLSLDVVKEKVAQVSGCSPEELKVHYSASSDGRHVTTISDGKDINYQDRGGTILKRDTTLPSEICDIVWQLDDINSVREQFYKGEIAGRNAWKKFGKYFNNINEFAAQELIRNDKGYLALIDYSSEPEKVATTEEQANEREEGEERD